MPTTITGTAGVNQVAPNSVDFADLKNTLFNGLLAPSGYIKIPVNDSGITKELIVQWGIVTTSSSASTTVTYPTPFPTAARSVVGTVGSSNVQITFTTGGTTAVSFVCDAMSTGGRNVQTCSWVAIGY